MKKLIKTCGELVIFLIGEEVFSLIGTPHYYKLYCSSEWSFAISYLSSLLSLSPLRSLVYLLSFSFLKYLSLLSHISLFFLSSQIFFIYSLFIVSLVSLSPLISLYIIYILFPLSPLRYKTPKPEYISVKADGPRDRQMGRQKVGQNLLNRKEKNRFLDNDPLLF